MESNAKVISIIDKEITRKNKLFFTLAQANKALKDSGEFKIKDIENQLLKKLLEKGEIKHSFKTMKKPRQWYIFHSSTDLTKTPQMTEQQVQKNVKNWKSVKKRPNYKFETSNWWDKPNLIDPRFSNRSIVKFWAVFLFIFLIIIIGSVSSSSDDDFIQNLKAAKERRLKQQETEQWFRMMEAHPEAFE